MTNTKVVVLSVVVSLVVGLAFLGFTQPSVPSLVPTENVGSGGNVTQQIDYYTEGVGVSDVVFISPYGTIGAGANQGAWENTTGRTVYANKADFGWNSGTASSTWSFWVATSSAATLGANGNTVPTNTYRLIGGAITATSSTPILVTSTSTDNGTTQGTLRIADNEFLVFKFVETFGCIANGACETATSTNRGVTNFIWSFKGWYFE